MPVTLQLLDCVFDVLQTICVVSPSSIVVGVASNDITAGGGGSTDTGVIFDPVPPPPVHNNIYVVSFFGETDTEPDVAPPVLKSADPVQLSASVLDQVRMDCPPKGMLAGSAVKVTIGVGGIISIVTLLPQLFSSVSTIRPFGTGGWSPHN